MRSWSILAVVVLLGGGAWAVSALRGGGPDYQITTAEVESGPITMTVETLGAVEPLSTVRVGCETTGRIIDILVEADDPVKKNQIICRIDPQLVEAQHQQSVAELRRAKSALHESKINLQEQEANLPVATSLASAEVKQAEAALPENAFNWKRIDKLYQTHNASEAEWTSVKARYESAKAAVLIAQARLEQARNNERFLLERAQEAVEQAAAAEKLAQATFNTTKTQVDRCVIRSPIDGIVLKRFMDLGATVNAAFQTPVLFLLAPNLDRMRINAKVSESDIVHIDVGQAAHFIVEGKRHTEFEGTILKKHNQPEIVQGVATYTVVMEVNNDSRRSLMPGMSVNVVIDCVHQSNAIQITNKALRFKPPLDLAVLRTLRNDLVYPPAPQGSNGKTVDYSKKASAWRFDETTHQWQSISLWVGITDNLSTQVLSGARPGDRFVTSFHSNTSTGFSLKEALKLASPNNRSL